MGHDLSSANLDKPTFRVEKDQRTTASGKVSADMSGSSFWSRRPYRQAVGQVEPAEGLCGLTRSGDWGLVGVG